MPQAQEHHLHLLKKHQLSQNIYSFYFHRPSDFHYLPGQYLRLTLPHPNPDNRGTSRFFTIASSPHHRDHLMLTVKILQSTFKETLLQLQPEQQVKVFAPLGKFILDQTDPTPKIFLSGGMGITPFHSMLTYAAAKNLSTPLTLIASFPTIDDVIFHPVLKDLADSHPNLKIIYTLTQKAPRGWTGETGRITEQFLRKHIADIYRPTYYLVGPPDMVESTQSLLNSLNLPEDHIQTENFTGY